MSRGGTGLGVKLGSFLMSTQFIRRERGPSHPPAIVDDPHALAQSLRVGVIVKVIGGVEPPTFTATAYRLDYRGARAPVVNESGHPLVAVGATPVKATSYLLAALRRRVGRLHA